MKREKCSVDRDRNKNRNNKNKCIVEEVHEKEKKRKGSYLKNKYITKEEEKEDKKTMRKSENSNGCRRKKWMARKDEKEKRI